MTAREARSDGEPDPVWRRLLLMERDERTPVLLAVAAFACVLASIFLLTPLRDTMGLRGEARNLKYLWTITLSGTLAASFAFAGLSSRRPRRAFLGATYRAVAAGWLLFLALLLLVDGEAGVWIARAFYVFHAVVNVLLVSLFWALLADLLGPGQSRRLFGLVAVGGTIGALTGTAVTGSLAPLGLGAWIILPAALLLEVSVRCMDRLARRAQSLAWAADATGASAAAAALPLGGDALEGMRLVARSPYLFGIALFTFTFGIVQTFFVYQQQHITELAITGETARTEYFAWTHFSIQALALCVQLLVTGRLMRRIGPGGTLLVLPAIAVLGFAVLGVAHARHADALAVVTVLLVLVRGLNHATLRPARESLFVPLDRAVKFKAKSFADTFAFRGGDLAGAWSFAAFTLTSAAFVAVLIAAAWAAMGIWLARRHAALARAPASPGPAPAGPSAQM